MKTDRAHLFSLLPSSGEIPQWIHLMPAGTFSTRDGRGPYTLADPQAVIATSMAGGMLPIDQDHATDRNASSGNAAPARGWIIKMEARADGIWGEVDWTETGKALLADRAYRGISPVIFHTKSGEVRSIGRASLTNVPAISQLATLMNEEINMDWKKQLASLFSLDGDASDEDVFSAVKKAAKFAAEQKTTASLVAKAAGLDETLDADGLVKALASRQAQATDVEGLRSECVQGRDMGFDGKTLVHPDQLAVANQTFAPTEAEIDLARRQIAAFDDAKARGEGVAVVDGKIVENLHIVTARAVLAKAQAIAALEG